MTFDDLYSMLLDVPPVLAGAWAAWFFVGLLFAGTVVQVATVQQRLTPYLSAYDWFMLTLLLVIPPMVTWGLFRDAGADETRAAQTAIQAALGGYFPMWILLRIIERTLAR